MWRKDPRMENATSLAVSIKKHKIYITLGEQHDAFCHELTQINLLIRYHNWQLCANKNKGKNSIHTYDLKILLISGCRLQNSSGLRFLEMILIKTLSCRVRVVFLSTYGHIQSFFHICSIRMQKSHENARIAVKLKWYSPLIHCDVTCLFTAEKWNFSTQPIFRCLSEFANRVNY